MAAPQGPIVNFLFLGTNQHHCKYVRKDKPLDNIITRFFDAMLDDGESNFVHLFDGPGGKPSSDHPQRHLHPIVGTYNYIPDENIPGKGRKEPSEGIPDAIRRQLGKFFGKGVEDNVVEAAQYIQQLESLDKLPATVNLYGYSRGSYAALIIANMLYHMYPDIKVNLFLIEPVPGPGLERDEMATVIPPNVEKATIILQKNERRAPFEPLDKSDLQIVDPWKTKVVFETLPGGHDNATKFSHDEKQHVTRLANSLMYQQALQSGSVFKENKPPQYVANPKYYGDDSGRNSPKEDLTPDGQLRLYHQMQASLPQYKKMTPLKKLKYAITLQDRPFTTHLEDYTSDPDFFVTQRHRELFNLFLPRTFDYFFQMNTKGSTQDDVAEEVYRFRGEHADTYFAMRKAFFKLGINCDLLESVFNDPSKGLSDLPADIILASPSGRYHIEKSPVLQGKGTVDDELSYLNFAVRNIVDPFLVKRKAGRQTQSAKLAKALVQEVKSISDQVLKEEEKKIGIKNAIIKTCSALKEETGSKKLFYQLESIIDDSYSYAVKLQNLLQEHLDNNPTVYQDIHLQSFINTTKTKLQRIVNTESLSEEEKKEQLSDNARALSLNVYHHPIYDEHVKKLHSDISAMLLSEKTRYTPYLDRTIRKAKAYIFKMKVKILLQKIIAPFLSLQAPHIENRRQEKVKLMEKVVTELKEAKKDPGGADKITIINTILDGLNTLDKIRKKHGKARRGECGKILHNCLTELSPTRTQMTIQKDDDALQKLKQDTIKYEILKTQRSLEIVFKQPIAFQSERLAKQLIGKIKRTDRADDAIATYQKLLDEYIQIQEHQRKLVDAILQLQKNIEKINGMSPKDIDIQTKEDLLISLQDQKETGWEKTAKVNDIAIALSPLLKEAADSMQMKIMQPSPHLKPSHGG